MADIISLKNKIARVNEEKSAWLKKRKASEVQRIFHCSHCAHKCAKCGSQMEEDSRSHEAAERKLRVPYPLCGSCSVEYIDYIEHLKGNGDFDCYWHNDAWIRQWQAWIDYQGAIDVFLKSKEFNELLRELKQSGTDE